MQRVWGGNTPQRSAQAFLKGAKVPDRGKRCYLPSSFTIAKPPFAAGRPLPLPRSGHWPAPSCPGSVGSESKLSILGEKNNGEEVTRLDEGDRFDGVSEGHRLSSLHLIAVGKTSDLLELTLIQRRKGERRQSYRTCVPCVL